MLVQPRLLVQWLTVGGEGYLGGGVESGRFCTEVRFDPHANEGVMKADDAPKTEGFR